MGFVFTNWKPTSVSEIVRQFQGMITTSITPTSQNLNSEDNSDTSPTDSNTNFSNSTQQNSSSNSAQNQPKGTALNSGVSGNVQNTNFDPNKSILSQAKTLLNKDYLKWKASYEGYHQEPYRDYAQWSVGFGTKANGQGDRVSNVDDAIDRVVREMTKPGSYMSHIDKLNERRKANGHPGLNQKQVYAALSFYYNLGTGQTKSVDDLIINGKDQAAANKMLEYNKAGGKELAGLVARRKAEASLFQGGDFKYGGSLASIEKYFKGTDKPAIANNNGQKELAAGA